MKNFLMISFSFLFFVVSVLSLTFYIIENGNPYTRYLADRTIPMYLENQGYKESDILESHYDEPKDTVNKDIYHGRYMVIFKDEPDLTYYYGITKKGKQVRQFCEIEILTSNHVVDFFEGDSKHSEENCILSLENRD